MSQSINVDPQEISKFEKMAASWWDPEGDFKPLHQLNPLRLDYVDRECGGLFGKKTLDVGCGGGILSESMARLGAKVDGIDMGGEPLEVAKLHALESQLELNYRQITAEELAAEAPGQYQVVTCMEMLEHVPDPASVIKACFDLLEDGGFAFFSTINRNLMAYLQTIVGAEYLLKMLPVGTHDHSKFIQPAELMSLCDKAGFIPSGSMGIRYNPVTQTFGYTRKLDVNYMIVCEKQG
ncbi:bifunctional 2-polyprenyl-6-hydroxyphenol methylase/3-demethylubiquinol 3-O-methyltransferase UbiG [Paraferrimonas sedimenticola]|uniref:Ubiquinone biosynthesis O-methyltransferase n=1 Tax=Paraferrimonas sedimenticola TaxID=375674 RepID=A0AA37RWZ9_9GAMM|nr:bifunctional 2-polyprenyl-6-hydroxyphenol methylase/3-demethylubiquinol 3-O-methyltransferase UbiG [Paraferrimonas sedimenticola]GLP96623.1 ubiquinone biosynthesis O-methyltransferase [Paraferrimonas sedimenticola]